jgi:signal transduction histidine kinase
LSHEHLGLFDTPSSPREDRVALAIVSAQIVVSLVVLRLGDFRLPAVPSFLLTTDVIMFMGEVITTALLYAQATVFRSRALAILGTCYLATSLLLVAHALTFPGIFSPNGLLGAGLNTPPWIYFLRNPIFVIGMILYAKFKHSELSAPSNTERVSPKIGVHIFAAIVLATAITMLSTIGHNFLPPVFLDRTHVIQSLNAVYEGFWSVTWVIAIVVVWRRRSSVLDLWLLVALACWLLQTLFDMTNVGRFTVAFYWLFAMTLFSHLVVMLALLSESTRLYARLALSVSAWGREREARLMSIDALAAAISHEVAQPLTVLCSHANIGLRSLTSERPDAERAIKSLRAITEAGILVTGVIKNIRSTFAGRTGERTEFSLNELVHASLPLLQRELASERISVQLELDETLPHVLGDRVQLQRVLMNLLSNAIESLSATENRPHQIAIRSAQGNRRVVLEVSDNGVGIARADMKQIFTPFFTTKSTGTGLGLSLCRIIVQAHGGRLWAAEGKESGAVFHLELPSGAPRALAVTSNREVDSAA